ncbi:MAG TPA: arginine deiminase-related protein [Planctomycetota bacterium]|nr:arginine deiminase-related protein [Planctomycetota bacterium]
MKRNSGTHRPSSSGSRANGARGTNGNGHSNGSNGARHTAVSAAAKRHGVRTPCAPAPRAPVDASTLDLPAFLLNVPFSYAADLANNVWMQELPDSERRVDVRRAIRQFMDLYNTMASEAVVYLLPAPPRCGLQDLVFTANLGIALDHLPDRKPVVLSNFTAPGRAGEAAVGRRFFEAAGVELHVAPARFEGEADLKHLHDDVYVGGYGIRSTAEAYRWMEREFDMRVVMLEETDTYLYHLDCSVFPITAQDTLVCTELYGRSELARLAKHTNIVPVTADECYGGVCNSVRLHNTILNASNIHELKAGTEDYRMERVKNRKLEDVAIERGFEVMYVNLSEFHKGGALLSCLVMHLNRHSYATRLL